MTNNKISILLIFGVSFSLTVSCTDNGVMEPDRKVIVTSLEQAQGLWTSMSGISASGSATYTYKVTANGLYYYYRGMAMSHYFISNEGPTMGSNYGFYGRIYTADRLGGSYTNLATNADGSDGYGALVFTEVEEGVSLNMGKIGASSSPTTQSTAQAGVPVATDRAPAYSSYAATTTDPFSP